MGSPFPPAYALVVGGIAAASCVIGLVIANGFLDRPQPLRYRLGTVLVIAATVLVATVLTVSDAFALPGLPSEHPVVEWIASVLVELVAEVVGGIVLAPILFLWLKWLEPREVLREDGYDAGSRNHR